MKINGNQKKYTVSFIRKLSIKNRPQRKFVTSFLGVSTSSYL